MNYSESLTALNVKIIKRGCYVLIMLLLMFNSAYAAQNIKIEIPEVIYSTDYIFTLGKIAKISGGNHQTRKTLSNLTIYAENDKISRNEVLRAINESEASDARIELYMPVYTKVEEPGYEGNFTETSSTNTRQQPMQNILNVIFASRNIKKGDKIRPSDLISRPMKVTRPGIYALKPEEVTGFTAKKNIKQGEPILLINITNSDVVKRGRRVKIIARIGSASATVDGILMEDGRPGDWVKVRRADDKRVTLRARIINENLVEVQVE